ncbi:MAG: tetratricopeptide repeat protein [Anaerolineae bacterium]|nr:tetratricopeptide repeat protein [Anaerolineae bacterium]
MKRGIQINRDYSNLSFSGRRRGISPLLLALWAVSLLLVALVVWRFNDIQPQVLAAIQPPAPTLSAPTHANQAYNAYLAGDLALAESEFASATRMMPENVDYLYEYGRMLLLNNKAEQGLAVADQAIAAHPEDPRGYALKVYALDSLGRAEEAIPIGLTALDLDSNFAPTYAFLSGAYNSLGRWRQAQEIGARAVELDPDNIDARRAFAFSLNWTGRYDLAVQQLEAAIAVHPNLDFLYFELAGAYTGLRNEPAKIAIYQHVLEMDPENTKAMVRMCETYFGMRIDNLAQYWCEEALDRDENDARAWKQVGMIYYTRRNYESSIDAFNTCVDLAGSQYIECWYLRGLAHYRLDQCDEAVPILQEGLAYTDSADIQRNILQGLYMCAEADENYDFSIIPTPAPTPTPVPTPIGIF